MIHNDRIEQAEAKGVVERCETPGKTQKELNVCISIQQKMTKYSVALCFATEPAFEMPRS